MDPLHAVSKNAAEKTKDPSSSHGVLSSDGYPDKSINSLGALIEYAANRYPGEAGFYYPISSNSNTTYGSISWDQFHHLTNVIAAQYSEVIHQALIEANESKTQPTVALFGRGNTIEYYITQMALQKLNTRTLLLAENTSPEAMRGLIQRCSVLALIIESGLSLHAQDLRQIPMIEDPFDKARNPLQRQETLRFDDSQDPWERQVFIIHSTGSTGSPKPIIHTNRSILTGSKRFRIFPDLYVENQLLLVPLYAVTGAVCAAPSGYAYNSPTTFPPRSLTFYNTPTSAIVNTISLFSDPSSNQQRPQIYFASSNSVHIVALYHHIRSTTNNFTPLRQFKLITFGGAALERSVLQELLKEGVNLKAGYGSTELGPLMRTYPSTVSNSEIEKMRLLWPEGSGLVMEPLGQENGDEDELARDGVKEQKQGQENKKKEQGEEREQSGNNEDNLYELVAYPSFPGAALLWGPSSHTGLSPSEPFRTNDLFREVPPKGSGCYILEGRKDDTIMVASALCVNAVAIEQKIVAADPGIKNALVMQPSDSEKLAALVEVDSGMYEEDGERNGGEGGNVNGNACGHDDKDVQESVHKAVEAVNKDLLEWERVEGGMIKVLERGKNLPVTGKGNVKRKEAQQVFGTEIEELFGAERTK